MNQPPLPATLQDGCPDSCPDWCYWVRADQIPPNGQFVVPTPSASDYRAMAARLGVEKIEGLAAKIHLLPRNGGHVVEVRGQFSAHITQSCVKTLEPMISMVADEFTAWFADYDQAASFARAQVKAQCAGDKVTGDKNSAPASGQRITEQQMLDERDDPEPMTRGRIDLADLVQQFLSLAINPYPCSITQGSDGDDTLGPGLNLGLNPAPLSLSPAPNGNISQNQDRHNPFRLLKNWRPKD